MDKRNIFYYVKRFLPPVILLILGLILIFSPDSATTVLVQIIGWILIAAAVGLAAAAVMLPDGMVSRVVGALIFGAAGIWMVSNPLALAAWFGRLIGLLLMIQGFQDLLYQRSQLGPVFLPILTAVVGTVLLVLPMTTSRLMFIILGIVVLIIAVMMIVERVRQLKQHREPGNPNIIDAL